MQEQKYTLPRPTDADLLGPGAGLTPGSSGMFAADATCRVCFGMHRALYQNVSCDIAFGMSGRKRSRPSMQPKDSKDLELDVTDAMYSSSQQINGQQIPGKLPIEKYNHFTLRVNAASHITHTFAFEISKRPWVDQVHAVICKHAHVQYTQCCFH